jgi:hypothetical protein
MRKSGCLLALLCFCSAGAVRATAIDPRIIITPDGPSPIPVPSSTFTFESNESGGGFLIFMNETGHEWAAIDFFATLPSDSTFSCDAPNLYQQCGPVVQAESLAVTLSSQFDIRFSAPNPGILPGQDFNINLNDPSFGTDPSGAGGWGSNNTIQAVVTFGTIPEPASWLLFAGGAALLAMLRRYRGRVPA